MTLQQRFSTIRTGHFCTLFVLVLASVFKIQSLNYVLLNNPLRHPPLEKKTPLQEMITSHINYLSPFHKTYQDLSLIPNISHSLIPNISLARSCIFLSHSGRYTNWTENEFSRFNGSTKILSTLHPAYPDTAVI